MDVTVRVPALEKLVDYGASGVGAVAGPMLANWRASREGAARLTSARIDAEVRRLEAKSNSESLRIIADAQAIARQSIDTTSESEYSMVEITRNDIVQSIEFQGRKRLANVAAVVEAAADELSDKDVSDHEPNHDWTARFFNDIQDVSSQEMQLLWARVLSGEVQRPGSTSVQALSILRNLDQATARIFTTLCSACVSLRQDGHDFLDARVPSLKGNAAHNSLKEHGLSFDILNVLNEHGLIISDYDSWYDYGICMGIHLPGPEHVIFRLPLSFQGHNWTLMPATERSVGGKLKLSGVALTGSGQELSRVVKLEPMKKYTQALMNFFQTKKLQMIKTDNEGPTVG